MNLIYQVKLGYKKKKKFKGIEKLLDSISERGWTVMLNWSVKSQAIGRCMEILALVVGIGEWTHIISCIRLVGFS